MTSSIFYIKFKSNYNGDVRRFSFEDRPEYKEFRAKLADIYHFELEELHITYKDDTNDNISITNRFDFEEALKFYRDSNFDILRVNIEEKGNSNNGNANKNGNSTGTKNVGDLESLFISLLSNQMIQQMIPQVIGSLASNPTLMTNIIHTASSSLRSQSLLHNTKSPNTFHTQSTDSILLNLPKNNISSENYNNNNNSNGQENSIVNLKKSSDETFNSMIVSSSSSSSLDMAKSFEEIDNSPNVAQTSSPPIATTTTTTSTPSTTSDKEKKPSGPILSVPKIFQNIHLPFTSSNGKDSNNNSNVQFKKENSPSSSPSNSVIEPSNSTSSGNASSNTSPVHEYIPSQVYPVTAQPIPYVSPSFSNYQLPPQNNSIITPQPYQPPLPYSQNNIVSPQPQPPINPTVKPTAPVVQPNPGAGNQDKQVQDLLFLRDAFQISESKAKEIYDLHKGDMDEICNHFK